MPNYPAGTKVINLRPIADMLSQGWQNLFGRRFGPGVPIQPDPTSEEAQSPRQFQYPTAVNTVLMPRTEYPDAQLTPFEQLRNLAAFYDIAAMCIATRIEELQGLEWDIVNKGHKEGNKKAIKQVKEFFQSPDKLNSYTAWVGQLLYDMFSIDAMSIYKRPDRKGDLYSLEVVDGATIKPLIDERGRTLAYQQVLYGFPESQYKRPSANAPDEELPIYAPNELMYRPRWVRPFTPYGSPPIEWIILRVNTALRKQTFDMSHFTEGNIPEMIATPPKEVMLNPDQVRDFELAFNALLDGNDAERNKVKFIPWPLEFKPLRTFSQETQMDEWMLSVTCAAFGVPPQEIGFTNDVNRATAGEQAEVNQRRGLRPLARWLKQEIFDPVICFDLGYDDLEWHWDFGDTTDLHIQSQTDQIYYNIGVITKEELRSMRFGELGDLPEEEPEEEMPVFPGVEMGEKMGEDEISDEFIEEKTKQQAKKVLDKLELKELTPKEIAALEVAAKKFFRYP